MNSFFFGVFKMNELSVEKTMTIKEVSEVLGVTSQAVTKHVKAYYPEKLHKGKTTNLNEQEITFIKSKMKHTTKVVSSKTNLEKKMIVAEAMKIIYDEISCLKDQIKRLTHSNKLYTSTEIGKELHLKSGTELNKVLQEKEIQYKVNNTWVLTSEYAQNDYTSIKQIELENGKIIYDRKWTDLGRQFVLEVLS